MTSLIARTGRVQDWIDNPDGRLPVSCTVFDCNDSMEGRDGIQSSWIYSSFALRNAAGVAVHLSKLRPKNTDNGKGLVSSGPVSFGKILSSVNETLRRGGLYKSGAIVLHINLEHDDILESGDSYSIPANIKHSIEVLEAGTVIDLFVPPRKDYL